MSQHSAMFCGTVNAVTTQGACSSSGARSEPATLPAPPLTSSHPNRRGIHPDFSTSRPSRR